MAEYASCGETVKFQLPDCAATAALGAAIGRAFSAGMVYLYGDLGAGKTSMVRALLRSRGVEGAVRSPTYTLVETYETDTGRVFHLDLYRLAEPEELHFIGLDELEAADLLTLVEWPERGSGVLPAADLVVRLEHCNFPGEGGSAIDATDPADSPRHVELEPRSDSSAESLRRALSLLDIPSCSSK
ncbi:tRNA (adenosine(37)-N6)-threonylcarbamoyltransferase complex ATPase subunit type 1 TsaE [Halorhodospira halochloris]|nr:tRNA (adenosine(37)-N6)-threonylcarbamoyltransferase complex ATPase subunit type 1 TsaE [Halorhodospira halochloris]MBK1651549.1 tRNA (adenosine(37)-N6)-threonylcarbamoyltransferase complex ATPase subunit type 1 TsaE [Halorhodospira halochloris]